jgi:DNA-binding response OmpR family regulator
MRVLLIEDNDDLARGLKSMLDKWKIAVDVAADGDTGYERFLQAAHDVAIIDVVLPRRDGFSICRLGREEGVRTPVLMLTARDEVEDRVRGLDCGADDYLVKPFDYGELVARLRALLRRGDRPLRVALRAGPVEIDAAARIARCNGTPLDLGATEFRLLELFVRNAGITLSRETILERVWEYEFEGSTNIVDVYVSRIRAKLRKAGARDALATVWGVGYRIAE